VIVSAVRDLETPTRAGGESVRAGASARAFLTVSNPNLKFWCGVADFDMNGRARRPPPDVLNCLLSFCYALLVKDLVAICLGVGLDPYLGVMHRPRFGRPALALDLAEEFRPLIAESTVINLLNNGEIQSKHFVRRNSGVTLTADGRKKVIEGYERRLDTSIVHPIFRYKISYRRVLDVQARILAAVVLGELDTYTPMVTR